MIRISGAKTALLLAAVVGPGVGTARAAGPFESELGTDPAALAGEVKLSLMNGNADGDPSGRGPRPWLQALGGPPKRVALASFYVWDCGNKKENHYNPVYQYKRTYNVMPQAIDAYANELYNASIGGLKTAFAANGMQLLTADEFLDTDAKRQAYESFQLEMGGMAKLFMHFEKSDADTWHFLGAPEFYRVFQLPTTGDVKGHHFPLATTGGGVARLAESLGHDLTTTLGVDAVVVLYNVVQGERKAIAMWGSYMYMFGPNPVPDSGKSLYWSGHQYSGVMLRMNVEFIQTDSDGNALTRDYAGYSVVPPALAARMAEHLKERSAK